MTKFKQIRNIEIVTENAVFETRIQRTFLRYENDTPSLEIDYNKPVTEVTDHIMEGYSMLQVRTKDIIGIVEKIIESEIIEE